jgi:hypothetical protein
MYNRAATVARMPRVFLLLLAGLALVPAATAQPQQTRLVATVGPGFTITLTDGAGTLVQRLTPGRYDVHVRDLSNEHNFVLGHKSTGRRPIETGVEFVGDLDIVVDLAPGEWVFACSPHFQTMNGRLMVAATQQPTAPQLLTATVTSGRLSLAPRRVAAGRYTLTVADRSATRGFRLTGAGVDRRTGNAYVGTVRWRVRLVPGTYLFGDQRKLVGRLVVR